MLKGLHLHSTCLPALYPLLLTHTHTQTGSNLGSSVVSEDTEKQQEELGIKPLTPQLVETELYLSTEELHGLLIKLIL